MPTEDLGDPFLPILCLLKIFSSRWRPILAVFVPVSFQLPKIIVLVTYVQKEIMQGFASLGTDGMGLI